MGDLYPFFEPRIARNRRSFIFPDTRMAGRGAATSASSFRTTRQNHKLGKGTAKKFAPIRGPLGVVTPPQIVGRWPTITTIKNHAFLTSHPPAR